ncbi:response regulator [Natrinema altunense]|uniref:PAS sensor protein n=1 Tax=Natrinema altunense (strain JCM 12890 / CGMCC 1.3731 / AJ2) TaxID=1227494 RepID=L9ZEE7_NATA2|nr:response regulator [Natrinema altunense]ELY83518.1 PAS sensor protein [Natrinema altunense JCM 12890]
MSPGIHVLCIDDDPHYRELTATVLERRDDDLVVTTAETGREVLAIVDGECDTDPDHGIDCVVSDYDMPGMDGLELFAAMQNRNLDVPFILFTGVRSAEIADEVISAGVTDYVRKGTGTGQYDELAARIETAVESHRADRESDRVR